MPGWTRTRLAALFCAALLLTACDAGHKSKPGVDNTWGGPELAIQLPGPSTTVSYALDEAGWAAYKAGEHAPIRAMVHLRALNVRDEVVVRYAVDDGPFKAHDDPTTAFDLPAGLAPGTHLISAYVANKAGEPHRKFGPKSAVVAEFHVKVDVTRANGTVDHLGGESNAYGHQVDGVYRPFERGAPQLMVERRGATVNVLVLNAELAEDNLRLVWGDTVHATGRSKVVKLDDASSSFTVALERKVGEDWVRVEGARSTWPMARP